MNHSLLPLLQRCQSLKSLKSIHAKLLISASIASSDHLLNRVLRIYSRFGAMDSARKVFDEITQPNAFIWTALIHGYVENRHYNEALSMFCCMHSKSVAPLNFTVSSVLKALGRQTRMEDGMAVYGFSIKFCIGSDLIVQNGLVDFLMRCGKVDFARQVFDEMIEKDVVSWNSMISGYGSNGRVDVAQELFERTPERNAISWTSMICGYVKAGDMGKAQAVFDAMPSKDLPSWNVILSGFMDVGDLVTAQRVFEEMPTHDVGTWNIMISGFCKAGEVESAEAFWDRMPHKNVMSWSIMMDGYLKAGYVDRARLLFDQVSEKNLVLWSTMIGGYARNGLPRQALELYKHFKEQGIKPDETFMLGIISACSQLGILETAESIFNDYMGPSLFSNLRLVTSLIDMYAKCGSIKRALQVYKMAYKKDLLCYSTMIAAFANHGLVHDAISLFDEMQKINTKPDGVTFLGVLSACNHGGLVNEGKSYLKQMTDEYGITPSEKHYACVVDLLGRAGFLEEAHDLIRKMPIEPNSVVWGALLAACRVHKNVQLGEVAAAELFRIEHNNSGNYILLSNIYAAAGRWDDVAKVRGMIKKHQILKNRASSWIELECVIHEFVMGDMSHSDSEKIYIILDLLTEDMNLMRVKIETTNATLN